MRGPACSVHSSGALGPRPPFSVLPSVEERQVGPAPTGPSPGRGSSKAQNRGFGGGRNSVPMLPLAPSCLLLWECLQADTYAYLHGLALPSPPHLVLASLRPALPLPRKQARPPQPSSSLLLLQEAFPHHSGVRIPLLESLTTSTQTESVSPSGVPTWAGRLDLNSAHFV